MNRQFGVARIVGSEDINILTVLQRLHRRFFVSFVCISIRCFPFLLALSPSSFLDVTYLLRSWISHLNTPPSWTGDDSHRHVRIVTGAQLFPDRLYFIAVAVRRSPIRFLSSREAT
jgi:hypothetical protein